MEFVPNFDRLSEIFSNAVAPAFFLGTVAAFVSLMTLRLAALTERIRALIAAEDDEHSAAVRNRATLAPLVRRARLLSDGIVLSLTSGICATLLLAILFAGQFLHLDRAYGAALLFIAATLLLGVALFRFAQEAWHARGEMQHLRKQILAFRKSTGSERDEQHHREMIGENNTPGAPGNDPT